jgi:mannose-6-phosphate isomerase-like protein (cupin superfamily)
MQGLSHYEKEIRPWGNFERFTLNEPCTVKIITIDPDQEFSLQQHEHRDEEWRILRAQARCGSGMNKTFVQSGEEFFVARGTKHRVRAGEEGLVFLEIALEI